ncbi:MAG: hypothetical protein DWQ34_03085 [Planctomycetota bacterium]|nr:MAG: hypothetical protein DWQ34_03085 [Planctomycetota bacterium]
MIGSSLLIYRQLWDQLLQRGDRHHAAWLIHDLFRMHESGWGASGSIDPERRFGTNDVRTIWKRHIQEILAVDDSLWFDELHHMYASDRDQFRECVRQFVERAASSRNPID